MKLNYTKEWFEKMAKLEGDSEIGAGVADGWLVNPEWIELPDCRFVFHKDWNKPITNIPAGELVRLNPEIVQRIN